MHLIGDLLDHDYILEVFIEYQHLTASTAVA